MSDEPKLVAVVLLDGREGYYDEAGEFIEIVPHWEHDDKHWGDHGS